LPPLFQPGFRLLDFRTEPWLISLFNLLISLIYSQIMLKNIFMILVILRVAIF
jgi:hypothetical protein